MFRRLGNKGLRGDINPALTLPVDLRYATLIAEAGVTSTFYSTQGIDKRKRTNPYRAQKGKSARTAPDLSIRLFSQANRVWNLSAPQLEAVEENLGESRFTALRHNIQGRLEYGWRYMPSQIDNPYYTIADRLVPKNDITLTIDNTLTLKEQAVSKDNDAPEGFSLKDNYKDILGLSISVGYDLQEARRSSFRDRYARRPWPA